MLFTSKLKGRSLTVSPSSSSCRSSPEGLKARPKPLGEVEEEVDQVEVVVGAEVDLEGGREGGGLGGHGEAEAQ